MNTSRQGSSSRRRVVSSGLAVAGLLSLVGCQAEYAGMTLPSGRYLHDDIQYFQPGPHFRWANTQAATQRARMEAMGIPVEEETAPRMIPAPPRPAAEPGVNPGPGGTLPVDLDGDVPDPNF